MIGVKITDHHVKRLALTRFIVAHENNEYSVSMHRFRKLGLYSQDPGFIFSSKTQKRLVCAQYQESNAIHINQTRV